MIITAAMLDLAASRYRENGFDFMQYTPHKIAHELINYDSEFKTANYTNLVSLVRLWQKGFSE